MKREIRAQDVKPGMDIGWDERGYRYAIGVARVDVALHGNGMCPSPMVEVYDEHDYSTVFHPEFEVEVTVDLPPQPDEPTAFSACVEVGGVKYVRCDDDHLAWKGAEDFGWWGWESLCDKGHVTVINADPFATPEVQEDTKPRKWDRWEDVPDMVAVQTRDARGTFRRKGDHAQRVFNGRWVGSTFNADKLNWFAPFYGGA